MFINRNMIFFALLIFPSILEIPSSNAQLLIERSPDPDLFNGTAMVTNENGTTVNCINRFHLEHLYRGSIPAYVKTCFVHNPLTEANLTHIRRKRKTDRPIVHVCKTCIGGQCGYTKCFDTPPHAYKPSDTSGEIKVSCINALLVLSGEVSVTISGCVYFLQKDFHTGCRYLEQCKADGMKISSCTETRPIRPCGKIVNSCANLTLQSAVQVIAQKTIKKSSGEIVQSSFSVFYCMFLYLATLFS